MNIEDLPQVIKFHRKKAGLTQKELADLAGIGKTAVFDIEKGKNSVKLRTLIRVLVALNIKLEINSPLMNEYNRS